MANNRNPCGRNVIGAILPSIDGISVMRKQQTVAKRPPSQPIDLAKADVSNRSEEPATLWELCSPDAMATVARDLFGDSAVTAVAWCALSARSDGRYEDFRFWFAVFVELGGVTADGSC